MVAPSARCFRVHKSFLPSFLRPPARRAALMAPIESGGAAAIRTAAGDLALAYAWTVVCFRAWDDALER